MCYLLQTPVVDCLLCFSSIQVHLHSRSAACGYHEQHGQTDREQGFIRTQRWQACFLLLHQTSRVPFSAQTMCTVCHTHYFVLETNLASHWEGVRLPRTSGKSPDFPGSPANFPGSFRRLLRKFSHCGTEYQSRGSPEVSQTSPEVSRTSPEVPRTSLEVPRFSGKPDTLF